MAINVDVIDENLIFFMSPWPSLQPHFLAAWSSPHFDHHYASKLKQLFKASTANSCFYTSTHQIKVETNLTPVICALIYTHNSTNGGIELYITVQNSFIVVYMIIIIIIIMLLRPSFFY